MNYNSRVVSVQQCVRSHAIGEGFMVKDGVLLCYIGASHPYTVALSDMPKGISVINAEARTELKNVITFECKNKQQLGNWIARIVSLRSLNKNPYHRKGFFKRELDTDGTENWRPLMKKRKV